MCKHCDIRNKLQSCLHGYGSYLKAKYSATILLKLGGTMAERLERTRHVCAVAVGPCVQMLK